MNDVDILAQAWSIAWIIGVLCFIGMVLLGKR